MKATGTLVFFIVTAAIGLKRGALATTSAFECQPEAQGCVEDVECGQCTSTTTQEEIDAVADCVQGAGVSDFSCASRSVTACCLDAVSANDCLGNDGFVAEQLCSINSIIYDDITISGVEVQNCADIDCSAVNGSVEITDDAGTDDGANTVGEGTDDAVGDDGVTDGDDVTGVQPFVPNSADQCTDELQACYDQEECYGCIYAYVTEVGDGVVTHEEWTECWSNYDFDPNIWCTQRNGNVCCTDFVSANDCVGNTLYMSWSLCVHNAMSIADGQGECGETVTCVAGHSAGGAARSGSSLSFAVLASGLGVALLTAALFSVV